MKVSIITVAFNSESTINDTLESVKCQNYADIEYIIIDGGSKDSTLKIINKFYNISKLISESDNGIYDAMNKGLALATGDIIGILNSDDLFYSEDTISSVAKIFEQNSQIDAVYGDLTYFKTGKPEKSVRFWKSIPYYATFFDDGYVIAHPTLFIRKKVYSQIGNYYSEFKLSSDYELMLRAFKVNNFQPFYTDKILVRMRMGGESTKNWQNTIRGNIEIYKSWKMNNLTIPPLFYFKRFIYKIKQLVNNTPPLPNE